MDSETIQEVSSSYDPNKFEQLLGEVSSKRTQIMNIFSDILETMPAKIEEAYSGEAAIAYRNSLNGSMAKLNADFDSLIQKLEQNAREWGLRYEAQDKANAESLSGVSNS